MHVHAKAIPLSCVQRPHQLQQVLELLQQKTLLFFACYFLLCPGSLPPGQQQQHLNHLPAKLAISTMSTMLSCKVCADHNR